jgi:hypothetical protein
VRWHTIINQKNEILNTTAARTTNILALYILAVSLTTISFQSETLQFSLIIYLHASYNPQKEIDYFLAQD